MRVLSNMLFMLFFTACLALAGDTATFTTLGFSADHRYFAFSQYGEQDGSGFPYAEIYIVDVLKNSFVSGGVINSVWQQETDIQANGIHVLLESRTNADSLLDAYGIDAKIQPRTMISQMTTEREHVEWRAPNGDTIKILLKQEGDGDLGMYNSNTAFQLEIQSNLNPAKIIGNFKRFRKHVIRYDIDRVLTSEDTKSVLVVIRMTKMGFEGPDIRYMIEAFIRDDQAKKNK